jgi:reactive intermediate/imine deaminase
MNTYNAISASNTPNAPKSIGPYSQSVAFSHYNNISAQLPIDPRTGEIVAGGVQLQAGQCFENIKVILESIDHVMDDVVRISVFVKNISDVDAVDEVFTKFFPSYVPTRTTVAVAALPMGALVQVEALVSHGEGTIPNAPQAGDLIKVARNTKNAPLSSASTQTVAFSHYNNLSAQLPIDPISNKLVPGGIKEIKQLLFCKFPKFSFGCC